MTLKWILKLVRSENTHWIKMAQVTVQSLAHVQKALNRQVAYNVETLSAISVIISFSRESILFGVIYSAISSQLSLARRLFLSEDINRSKLNWQFLLVEVIFPHTKFRIKNHFQFILLSFYALLSKT